MAEEANFGVARLRQAITNQAACGSGQFELSIDSADRLCLEIEDELARLSWAVGVPVPRDADGKIVPLDTTELYMGEGEIVDVERITFNGFLWHAWDSGGVYRLGTLHLNRPDSWEQLEEDADKGVCDYFGHSQCLKCPGYNHAGHSCDKARAQDIVRRAKGLADRDAKEADRD